MFTIRGKLTARSAVAQIHQFVTSPPLFSLTTSHPSTQISANAVLPISTKTHPLLRNEWVKKVINLYIIATQNNKDCVCFLYKQEPENIKSQLPLFITDEHGLKEIKVLLCTNTMGSSSHNKTLSCNAVTKDFSRPTSRPVQGWTGNNKALCSHGTQDGCRVIKVYSIKWWCRGESWAFHSNK